MKISKPLQIILLLTVMLELQTRGQAQGNLVNLYNWTVETPIPPNCYVVYPGSVTISSSNSATFYSGQNTITNIGSGWIYGANNPTLRVSLDTIAGATYEITCTLQNYSLMTGLSPQIVFGDYTTNLYVYGLNPVTIDFISIATSATTATSVGLYIGDPWYGASLANFSVIAVPEISAVKLLGFGGCVLIFAQRWRRLFQKRKRN